MDDFALLFETLVLVLTGSSFVALVGFIVWDAMADRKQAARLASGRERLSLVRLQPARVERSAGTGWVISSRAA